MSDLANFLASFNNDEPIVTDSRISGGGRLIDADTAQTEEGVRVRFPNVNAREVDTFDPAKGLFKKGEQGGDLQKAITKLAMERQGFNQPILTNKKDLSGERTIGDFGDGKGSTITNYQIENNLVDLLPTATAEQTQLQAFGKLGRSIRKQQGTESEGDLLYNILQADQSRYPIVPKGFAPSAKMYGAFPEYFTAPKFQKENETKTGYVKDTLGQIKAGLGIGYESTAKDFYNAYRMRQQGMGNKEEDKWAAIQIDRLASELEAIPLQKDMEAFDARSGEWQLNSLGKVFNHAIGVLSSSAVPMGVTIGANILGKLALSNPVTMAGYPVAMSVPVAMNAGRVWGNQPEDQKDETRAWIAGAGITALDSLGLAAIAPKAVFGTFGKKQFDDYALQELMKKGATKQEAIDKLKDVYGSVNKQLGTVFKRITTGAGGEGLTEPAQDLVEHWGSNPQGMGDSELLKNKLKNSAFSGALVGGVLAVPGSIMENRAFKNYLAGEIGEEMSSRTRKSSAVEAFQNKNGVLSDLDLALQVKMDRLNNPVGSVPLDPATIVAMIGPNIWPTDALNV